jgi:excisionase family DNA binding protein
MAGPYDPKEPCLDIPELSAWLTISVRHVRRLVSERRIPFHKIGGLIRFIPSEIADWLDDNGYGTCRVETDIAQPEPCWWATGLV